MNRIFILTGLVAALIGLAALGSSGDAMAAAPTLDMLRGGDIPPELAALAFGGLIVNEGTLTNLFRGFKASFQQGLGMAKPMYERVATVVPSDTGTEEYGWLGKMPNVREWVGDRVIQNIAAHAYSIRNKDFELTLGVGRNDIEDDKLGMYGPLFQQMGQSTGAHPDQLVWPLLKAGFATACYDGQYYFDTDHPVLDENGVAQSVANTDGGSGTSWFLIDTSKVLKPILYQRRKPFEFVSMTRPTDHNVFMNKQFIYGVDGRSNVGYGFWQFAWGSKQTLSKTTYGLARESLMAMKGDYGRPLGVMPNLLIVPPALESKGLEILNAERDAAGATNVYKGTAELLVVPWLA